MGGMGCGDCEGNERRVKGDVARGGWAEAARRTPATLLLSHTRKGFI